MVSSDILDPAKLSIEQLAARAGLSVRTVRFYASRGLIAPPRREGRNGFYGQDHLGRLELVKDLQAHGFTLAAIEGYLERIPADASPEQVALYRTLLAPWSSTAPELLTRSELQTRAGRELSDDNLELLVALGVIEPMPEEDVFRLTTAHLAIGIGFLEAGLSLEAAQDSRRIINEHGQALAQELTQLFLDKVWPRLKVSDQPPEVINAMVARFKPLSVQALVVAYEEAVDERKRLGVRQRSNGT